MAFADAEEARQAGLRSAQSKTPEQRRKLASKGHLAQAVTAVVDRSDELTEDQKARIHAAVVASRRAQGLGDHVSDPAVLAQLAAEVAPGGAAP